MQALSESEKEAMEDAGSGTEEEEEEERVIKSFRFLYAHFV
jgi:hypothetical protein